VRAKNFLAFIMILGVSVFYSLFYYDFESTAALVFDAATYMAFAIILYVLVAFKLYDRVDAFLDKKIGKGKPLPRNSIKKTK
jgi:hypothetical protein